MYKIYYETILNSINSFVGYKYFMLCSLVSAVIKIIFLPVQSVKVSVKSNIVIL